MRSDTLLPVKISKKPEIKVMDLTMSSDNRRKLESNDIKSLTIKIVEDEYLTKLDLRII
jgi:Tfp pilus assembly PilM family ATPase